jgi:hypothetical protein
MEITSAIIGITISLIILILTFSTLYFAVKIYMNLLKFKEAALGLIFTNIDSSIRAFKIYAVAVLIFAIGRILDLFNLISSSISLDNLATILYLTTDILLIYAFYKLLVITRIDNVMNKENDEK